MVRARDVALMCQSRPFGVALLIAGIDEKGPQLYVLVPSHSQSLIRWG